MQFIFVSIIINKPTDYWKLEKEKLLCFFLESHHRTINFKAWIFLCHSVTDSFHESLPYITGF